MLKTPSFHLLWGSNATGACSWQASLGDTSACVQLLRDGASIFSSDKVSTCIISLLFLHLLCRVPWLALSAHYQLSYKAVIDLCQMVGSSALDLACKSRRVQTALCLGFCCFWVWMSVVYTCHYYNRASLFDCCSFARLENARPRTHLFCLLVSVDHLRALLCSELRGILVETALLAILAHLHGLSPWCCSAANETFAYSLQL